MTVWWVAALSGLAVLLLGRPPPTPPRSSDRLPTSPSARPGWLRRGRTAWAALAWLAVLVFVPGPLGLLLGSVAATATWRTATHAEAPEHRRTRAEIARELPHVVLLLAAALRSGAAPGDAVRVVCAALPGAAAERLQGVPRRLAIGVDPRRVWGDLAADPDLAALGRTLGRAHETGAPVAQAVHRLAADLGREARAAAEDRARAVGVKAALPLGLCLLPAFLLLGIVPLVAGLAGALDW